jgi:glycosyltransferase involved in cell wall biosynthesis
VVTVTKGRPTVLRRAIASVFAQDYPDEIEHHVIIDDDPVTLAALASVPSRPGYRVVAHPIERAEGSAEQQRDRRQVYPRIAMLFNLGVRLCDSTWIAFLDDDNEFETLHLRSLLELAHRTGSPAVHSGRKMFWSDGAPYLDERWHTAPNDAEGARIYRLMCERGVRVPGTNLVLDRADPVRVATFRPSTVIRDDDPMLLVDQNVWLIRRDLLLRLPIPEVYTEQDYQSNTAPDDKMLGVLLYNDVNIVTNSLPSVRYYLGGISNGL